MSRLFLALSSAAFVLPAMAASAAAQEAAQDEVVYAASFFAEYAPQSALDMVRRTPGFSLDAGDNVRGFGAAAGNVLIDGARPAIKGDGLRDFLARIPAEQVLEVRLIRNAQTAEAQGQAVIVNVIRRRAETSGAWSAGVEQTGAAAPAPIGSLSFAGAALGFEGSFEIEGEMDETRIRTSRVFFAPDGMVQSNWAESRREGFSRLGVSGDARRPLWNGILAFTGAARMERFSVNRESLVYVDRPAAGAPDQFAPFTQDDEDFGFEFGADFSRSLGPADLKLVGVVTFETETDAQRDARRDANSALLRSATLVSESEALEVVVRASSAWSAGARWRFETAAETAYNRLDSQLALTENRGLGFAPIALPGAATMVEEARAEALFSVVYDPPGPFRLDGALGVETSEIAVRSDASNTQRFSFFEPQAWMAYDIGGGATARLGAERRIGQLDFADFAASARLGDGVSTAGNPALGPETAWVYGFDLDWRRPNGFALAIEASYEEREGVLEQVSLPSGGAGVANAGAAAVTSLRMALDWPLDGLIPGGTLSLFGESKDSVFSDPLTRAERLLSDFTPSSVEASFRHDPPGMPFSWGVEWRGSSRQIRYRIDERDERASDAQLSAFAEIILWGLRSRLELRNLGRSGFQRERRHFLPDRAGALSGIERRWTRYGTVASWEIAGRF